MRVRLGFSCLLLSFGACKPLPELEAGVCGNHVIDVGEDCDGFAESDQVCRPPDVSNPCHYDCSADAAGCPAGYGCDAEGICRKPTLRFVSAAEGTIAGGVDLLTLGDFDGDERMDVLALESARALGLRRPAVHFFDADANPRASWSTSVEIASPAVARVSGDQNDDLVFSVGALVVMQGESDQTLTPWPRASYYLEKSRIHTIPVMEGPVEAATPIAILHQTDAGLALNRPDQREQLKLLTTLEGRLEDLIGEPVSGDVFEDDEEFPCFDVSFALRGSPTLGLYQPCRRDPDTGAALWREEAAVTTLTFDPPSTPVGAPIFADLDGDGHLDVMCTALDGLYASFGDGQVLGPLEPFALPLEGQAGATVATPHALAAGDFSGDGIADLILPEHALISVAGRNRIEYRVVFESVGRPWTVAQVADLNADGKLDAIVASADYPDIAFLAGTGRGGPNPFVIPTIHPVNRMTVGDFDGDQIDDLAFVEPLGGPLVPDAGREPAETETAGVPARRHDQMSVAFGSPVGAPNFPVPIGHLADITELTAIHDADSNRRSDLMVVQDVASNAPSPAGTTGESTAAGLAGNSSLSIIVGNGDRTFYAPSIVSNFAIDGTLEGAEAIYVATGKFEGQNRLDVVMLGATGRPDGSIFYTFWFLPEVSSQQTAMRLLPFPFDLPFEPLRNPSSQRQATLRMQSADFDGDGVDELIVAGPDPDRAACLVQITKYDPASDQFVSIAALRIADSCSDQPLFQAGDFDLNGDKDLALLTGSISDGVHIRVLWNDGAGGLAEGRELPFFSDEAGETIRSFAFFQELQQKQVPFRLAYATPTAVRLFQMRARGRVLDPIGRSKAGKTDGTVAELFGGATSIVAGDVTGDRVTDLVVADSGDIHVLRAELVGR